MNRHFISDEIPHHDLTVESAGEKLIAFVSSSAVRKFELVERGKSEKSEKTPCSMIHLLSDRALLFSELSFRYCAAERKRLVSFCVRSSSDDVLNPVASF